MDNSSLVAGTTISHYRIVNRIGAGGMGEVYRASDTKLNREVAIKVLPETFAQDKERVARFKREAQVLASLNHPNVAAIYGLEESGSLRALVLELVEGPTLADRIAAGAVPLDEAIHIARQIADALEYAHEKGIIHRDLKPANVKVTIDGAVKVLDFGLAKVFNDDTGGQDTDLSHSPTLIKGTQSGMILGTAAYMSPEQAQGKTVDKRSDVWSFGVVLYEMLTGNQLFAGETVSDTLAAVLRDNIDWSALPDETPASMRELLARCLDRDRKQRLRDIGEARIAIEKCQRDPSGISTSGDAAEAPRERRGRSLLPWAVAAVFVVATLVLALTYYRSGSEQPRVVRAFIPPPEKTSFYFVGDPHVGPVALSPDGRRLVFSAKAEGGSNQLWVREISSPSAQPLRGTESGSYPFWSPDSRTLGFFADGKLKKIEVAGGQPQTLCAAPQARGGTWNRDGVIVFSPNSNSNLHRVSATGGASTPLIELDASQEENTHRWPLFLPDGNHFLYVARSRSGSPEGVGPALKLGSLAGDKSRLLMRVPSNVAYASGYLLFLQGTTLMAQAFDADKLELGAEAVPIAEGVQYDEAFARGTFSVSQNGVLVYKQGMVQPTTTMQWFDRSGKQLGSIADRQIYRDTALSQDHKLLATSIRDVRGGLPDIWIYDVGRGVRTRFTFDADVDRDPVWSPDGAKIVYASYRKGRYDLYLKSLAGSGEEDVLLESDVNKFPESWSADGAYIAFSLFRESQTDVWILPMVGEKKPFPFLQTRFNESGAVFSRDGRWIAYTSDESGREELYVTSFPSPGRKWQVSTTGGQNPRWRRDGNEIYYLATDNKMMATEVKSSGDTIEAGASRSLFETRAVRPGKSYDIHPDGQRFLINTGFEEKDLGPLTLVVNWTTELKKN
ncbi:MAG: protein kinase [Acidobacteriota bacterium]